MGSQPHLKNPSDLTNEPTTIDLTTGFVDDVDRAFAENSASYLLSQHYSPDQVVGILVQELGLSADDAATILARQPQPIT